MIHSCKQGMFVRFRGFLLACVLLLSATLTSTVGAVSFRVLGLSVQSNDLQLVIGNHAERQPLRIAKDALSRTYTAQAGQELRLFASTDQLANGAEVAELPLAVLRVPEGVEQAILVLMRAEDTSGYPLAGVWIDDSLATRPANSVVLHNFSGEHLGIKFGEAVSQLRIGEAMVHRFSPTDRSVVVQAAVERSGRWDRVLSRPQPVREGFRILMLLRDGQSRAELRDDVLDCLVFYDYLDPAMEQVGRAR